MTPAILICALVGVPAACLPDDMPRATLTQGPCVADKSPAVLAAHRGGTWRGSPICWREREGVRFVFDTPQSQPFPIRADLPDCAAVQAVRCVPASKPLR